jgi:hypothetical protein
MIYRSSLPVLLVALLAACNGVPVVDSKSDSDEEDSIVDSDQDSEEDSDSEVDSEFSPLNPDGEGPARVDLGGGAELSGAGSYLLLAKSGITNVTGSSLTGGHVGLSPADSTYITGFAPVPDASNRFATSSALVAPARIYASDYAEPTPGNLTSAVVAMQLAYTDAAGRRNSDYLNLEGGDLSGLTLAPGLYTWGTAVTIPGDVTFNGGADDVWILQIAEGLDVSAGKQVLLSGGAQARNVFWQVAGEVVVHEGAHFEGILLGQTGVTLQTNASMDGRILAQTLIALDDNAITAP